MTVLEDAARQYVAARVRLAGADPAGILAAICDVDTAWHELHVAADVRYPDCCWPDCEDIDVEREMT
jgi:hypothetical protein